MPANSRLDWPGSCARIDARVPVAILPLVDVLRHAVMPTGWRDDKSSPTHVIQVGAGRSALISIQKAI